jgi:flagellar motor component MotA
MERIEFEKAYLATVKLALEWNKESHRRGLVSLGDWIDEEKVAQRDIFHYGMQFVSDGTDEFFVDKILSNIINQEKDEDTKLLKNIQKEVVLDIQRGVRSGFIIKILNSYVDNELAQATWKNLENDGLV